MTSPNFSPTAVLSRLSQEEKIRLLCGADAWHLHGLPEHGVPAITLTDGPHGVRLTAEQTLSQDTHPATVFPVEATMASSWDTDLLGRMGAAIGREARALGVGVMLGPGLNGKRSPLAGRNFEYFSEDPHLTGALGAAYVSGMQAQGVGACIKHFAGNEQETRRFLINAEIDERTFRELYVFPFAQVIQQAEPWTLMSAYNGVNGDYACQNPGLLQTLLRQELGFTGLVMSDWAAVQDKVAAHKAGLDLEMPGPGARDQELAQALKRGELSGSELDAQAERVLTLIQRVTSAAPALKVDWQAHHELAVEAAVQGAVLLKNADSALPLTGSGRLAIIGEFAVEPRFQGGGSSHMKPRQLTSAWTALQARYETAGIQYSAGYTGTRATPEQIAAACAVAQEADQVVLFTGTTDSMECEGFDRSDMQLAPDHLKLVQAVAGVNPDLTVVLHAGAPLEVRQFETRVAAIVLAGLGGAGSGEAMARILTGEAEPGGRLTESWPVRLEHNPTFETFPGSKDTVSYSEGLFTGYRYYDTKRLPVQYPFGFGLGYTHFTYSDFAVTTQPGRQPGLIRGEARVTLTNVGANPGSEVVQLYVQDPVSTYRRPCHELKGFARTRVLAPGASEQVRLELDDYAFAYFVSHLGRFAVESGDFVVSVGASSRDLRCHASLTLTSDVEVRRLPTLEDTVSDWLADSRTRDVMQEVLDDLGLDEEHLMYAIALGFPIPQLLQSLDWMAYDEGRKQAVWERLQACLAGVR